MWYHTFVRRFHAAYPLAMSTRAATVRARKVTITGPKPPKARGGRAKKTVDEDKEDSPSGSKGGALRIMWNLPRTDRLVEWLENNVEDRQRLFSDSAHDAKEEQRRPRTARSGKTNFHIKMADYIFSVDEDPKVRDDVRENGAKGYAKAVENRITR